MVDKVIKDGKVAVLYTTKHGAGWSTWAHRDQREFMLFCPEVVNYLLEHGHADIEAFVENSATLKATGCYLGGAKNLAIEWVPQGHQFKVEEYDGRETIEVYGPPNYYIA